MKRCLRLTGGKQCSNVGGSVCVYTYIHTRAFTFLLKLHSRLLETERQLGEAHGRLKEQRQLSSEKLMDKEQQVADLQLKLSRLEEQVS